MQQRLRTHGSDALTGSQSLRGAGQQPARAFDVMFLQTYSGLVIAEIVDAVRMDYRSEDHRLWVNLDAGLAPK